MGMKVPVVFGWLDDSCVCMKAIIQWVSDFGEL